jgi:hypothetical protein
MRIFSLKMAIASRGGGRHRAVDRIVTGTALPLSTSCAMSKLDLAGPAAHAAGKGLMAAAISSGVAGAGRTSDQRQRRPPAARLAPLHGAAPSAWQPRHDVLDLLRVQDGLALPGRRDALQAFGACNRTA